MRNSKVRGEIMPFDDKEQTTEENAQEKNTSSTIKHRRRTIAKIALAITMTMFWFINIMEFNPFKMKAYTKDKIKQALKKKVDEDDEEHPEDPGIMVLGPPWNHMKHVVMDQPVEDEDVLFLWDTRESSGKMLRDMFVKCYNVEMSESVSGLERLGRTKGIFSQEIREIAALFSAEHKGRMFAFFRHPYYNFINSKQRSGIDNPMTRLILDQPDGTITFKGLGIAKKVIREKCVVGLLDEFFFESVERISNYYGWEGMGGKDCLLKFGNSIPYDKYGDGLMSADTKEWKEFMMYNSVDLQLYEYARSCYRAGYQTLIPRKKQLEIFDEQNKDEIEEE